MHEAQEGAFTGEVSPAMLAEVGVHGVVLGHSERRQLFGETDGALRLKVPAALTAGLVPILCVGETEEELERGDTERKLRHQVKEGLEKCRSSGCRRSSSPTSRSGRSGPGLLPPASSLRLHREPRCLSEARLNSRPRICEPSGPGDVAVC
jgi:hypothetical protein